MVEKSEFKDHAELGRDPEIVTMLDKSRNGISNFYLELYSALCSQGKSSNTIALV